MLSSKYNSTVVYNITLLGKRKLGGGTVDQILVILLLAQ